MEKDISKWHIQCDAATFNKCRNDEKFPYIVALSRAVNALNFAHSGMLYAATATTPEGERNRLNSYLFASSILYEAINLIRKMNRAFKADDAFQKGLRLVLRDRAAQIVEQAHLNPVRNGAVFHFVPKRFAEMIKNAQTHECRFSSASGLAVKDVYYSYADVIAVEILVGVSSDSEGFDTALRSAMEGTTELVIRFAHEAEGLIGHHLNQWGFEIVRGR